MGVERVDYYSQEEYQSALASEEQCFREAMQEDEEFERYALSEYEKGKEA